MSEKNKFEIIEKYLSGELLGEELADFENQILKDKNLAQEVDFQRNIEFVLAHQPEDDLRDNLKKLDSKYSKPSNKRGRLIFWGIGLVFLLGTLGWWMNQPKNNSAVSNPNESTEKLTESTTEEIPTKDSEPATQNTEEKTPEFIPQKKESKPAKQPDQTKKIEPRPIAANFEPNAYLESRLGSMRSDELKVEIAETNFLLEMGKIDFVLKGVLKSDDGNEKKEFILHIFSNKMEDYENFKPVFSKPLSFEKVEDDFQFNLSESIPLLEGLYYFQIEDEIGEVMNLNKFTVEKQ